MPRADYSFARRPKWIAGHLLALIGIVVFVQFGLWQLRRLDERRDFNAVVEARLETEYVSLDEASRTFGPTIDDLEWRRVEVAGSYDTSAEVIVQGRSYLGQSGHHVATPLVLADGSALIVNRGWVPIDVTGPPVLGAEPPAGEVTVRGIVRETQTRGAVGPRDPDDGVLERVARVDVARLQQQLALDLREFYLDLEEQAPAQSDNRPAALSPPDLGEGPHLSYAIQWFTFAGIVFVGYPILLRRTARPRRSPQH